MTSDNTYSVTKFNKSDSDHLQGFASKSEIAEF